MSNRQPNVNVPEVDMSQQFEAPPQLAPGGDITELLRRAFRPPGMDSPLVQEMQPFNIAPQFSSPTLV
jgi:hypothetical protein